jgi:biopolymer transport protein ExbD
VRRRQRRQIPQAPVFTFAPMVDIVLLLLIFFMTTTTFLRPERGLRVELPTASQAGSVTPLPDVTLTASGQIGFGSQTNLSPPALEVAVRAAFKGVPGAVSLRADQAARHGRVVEVMDAIKKAGATRLSVAVRQSP